MWVVPPRKMMTIYFMNNLIIINENCQHSVFFWLTYVSAINTTGESSSNFLGRSSKLFVYSYRKWFLTCKDFFYVICSVLLDISIPVHDFYCCSITPRKWRSFFKIICDNGNTPAFIGTITILSLLWVLQLFRSFSYLLI